MLIICGSIVCNYMISKGMEYFRQKPRVKKLVLAMGISVNLAVIFYFKYFDFFLENINTFFGKSFELKQIVLPLGISFLHFSKFPIWWIRTEMKQMDILLMNMHCLFLFSRNWLQVRLCCTKK